MATETMATTAGAAALLYYTLNCKSQSDSPREDDENVDMGGAEGSQDHVGIERVSNRLIQAPATWLSATLRFTYSETLGKWPITDLAFGINFLLKRQILKPAFTIVVDHDDKCIILLICGTHGIKDTLTAVTGAVVPFHHSCGTHGIKDTLTAVTGAVVPFHHSVVREGGVTNVVLGYEHCGMVAAARWIAKLSKPYLLEPLEKYPDYKIHIMGHSLGGGTAALVTFILREQKELSKGTCYTFASAACMTWELVESGNDFITSIINGADIVPTFSAASVDDLRAEVTASAWINDLRNQSERIRILSTIYRSALALGSRLPSIATTKAKVVRAGAILRRLGHIDLGSLSNVSLSLSTNLAFSSL